MPHVFGLEHLIYLAISLIVMGISFFLIHRFINTDKKKKILIKSLGSLLLCLIIANRICISLREDNWLYLIPESWCGCASFFMSFSLLLAKKDSKAFHFVSYLAFVGGLLTLIYPNFISQNESFFYHATITGLLHHTVLFFSSLALIETGYLRPTLKKWYCLPIGLSAFLTFGVLDITAFGFEDAMLIKNPILPDSIFTWWFLGICIISFGLLVMAAFDYLPFLKKKENKQ